MSRKLIYLHIGRGKTGTSAIQNFCTRSREALLRAGIRYVQAGDESGGHQALAKSLLTRLPDWMEPIPEHLRDIQEKVRVELLNSPEKIFLISSENLTLVEPEMAKGFFDKIFESTDFKIILFVRSQDELAESQYNQDVKWSKEQFSFQQYLKSGRCEELEYDVLLEPWDRIFGRENIIARIYDAARPHTIADFMSCLPLTAADLLNGLSGSGASRPDDIANESVGFAVLEIFRLLNGFDLPEYHAIYNSIYKLLKDNDVPAIFFSGAAAREFRCRFRDSNRRFSARYLPSKLDELGGRRYSDAERDSILAARLNFSMRKFLN